MIYLLLVGMYRVWWRCINWKDCTNMISKDSFFHWNLWWWILSWMTNISKQLRFKVSNRIRFMSNLLQTGFEVHLHELGNRWIPYELTPANKLQRFAICSSYLVDKKGLIFERIITCDKKWILYRNFKWKNLWLSLGDNLLQTSKGLLFQKIILTC